MPAGGPTINIAAKALDAAIRIYQQAGRDHFFQGYKTKVYEQADLYNKQIWLEINKPVYSVSALKSFYEKQLKRHQEFFLTHDEFCRYYYHKLSYLDEKYFLRENHDPSLCTDSLYFEADHRFTTSHESKVARLLAHEMLIQYLEQELARLEQVPAVITGKNTPVLKWTYSKLALIELVYALYYQCVLNDGKADIKEIACYFENMFGVSLGDYYRGFLDIKMRKTGRVKFLDMLKENLLKKMEEADERTFR